MPEHWMSEIADEVNNELNSEGQTSQAATPAPAENTPLPSSSSAEMISAPAPDDIEKTEAEMHQEIMRQKAQELHDALSPDQRRELAQIILGEESASNASDDGESDASPSPKRSIRVEGVSGKNMTVTSDRVELPDATIPRPAEGEVVKHDGLTISSRDGTLTVEGSDNDGNTFDLSTGSLTVDQVGDTTSSFAATEPETMESAQSEATQLTEQPEAPARPREQVVVELQSAQAELNALIQRAPSAPFSERATIARQQTALREKISKLTAELEGATTETEQATEEEPQAKSDIEIARKIYRDLSLVTSLESAFVFIKKYYEDPDKIPEEQRDFAVELRQQYPNLIKDLDDFGLTRTPRNASDSAAYRFIEQAKKTKEAGHILTAQEFPYPSMPPELRAVITRFIQEIISNTVTAAREKLRYAVESREERALKYIREPAEYLRKNVADLPNEVRSAKAELINSPWLTTEEVTAAFAGVEQLILAFDGLKKAVEPKLATVSLDQVSDANKIAEVAQKFVDEAASDIDFQGWRLAFIDYTIYKLRERRAALNREEEKINEMIGRFDWDLGASYIGSMDPAKAAAARSRGEVVPVHINIRMGFNDRMEYSSLFDRNHILAQEGTGVYHIWYKRRGEEFVQPIIEQSLRKHKPQLGQERSVIPRVEADIHAYLTGVNDGYKEGATPVKPNDEFYMKGFTQGQTFRSAS